MENGLTRRWAYGSAWMLAVGVLLSGPLTVLAVSAAYPQPVDWQGIEAYAKAFHPLQLATYQFGFLIVAGSLGLFAMLHAGAGERERPWSLLALATTVVYVAIISVNYMLQLAVLGPNLAGGRLEGMGLLAFNNPESVTMALEMLGYGWLGLSTAFVAPLFPGRGRAAWIRGLGVANAVVSALGTALQATVGMRGLFGLAVYVGWNVLFAALVVLYVLHLRPGAVGRAA